MEAELQKFKSDNIPCAKAELRDLKPNLLCGSGTAERQVAVYVLLEAELRNFQALFLVRKRNIRPWNLKSQYSGDRT